MSEGRVYLEITSQTNNPGLLLWWQRNGYQFEKRNNKIYAYKQEEEQT